MLDDVERKRAIERAGERYFQEVVLLTLEFPPIVHSSQNVLNKGGVKICRTQLLTS